MVGHRERDRAASFFRIDRAFGGDDSHVTEWFTDRHPERVRDVGLAARGGSEIAQDQQPAVLAGKLSRETDPERK